MSENSDSASGLDLRPLGADSDSAPSIGATPLVPVETDQLEASFSSGKSVGTTSATGDRPPGPTPINDAGAHLSILPAVPSSISREAARKTRTELDPIGHWDAVVACPVLMGPQGESSPVLRGAIHLFLTPGSLMRRLEGPIGAARFGLKVTRGRLLTLLSEGLNAGAACTGFWIYGMEKDPRFLPSSDLEPLAETIETILLLARASTGGIALADAVTHLAKRTFFHLGGWNSETSELDTVSRQPAVITEPHQTIPEESPGKENFRFLPLYVSPISLLKAGRLGQVATVRLDEISQALEGYDGVVVEPGTGYALTLSRAQLPVATQASPEISPEISPED